MTDYVDDLNRRMDEQMARQDALLASLRPRLDALEPVARQAAKDAQIKALEAEGNVVKKAKKKATSATLQASVTAVITSAFAAWSAYESGNIEAAGAALGATITAVIAIWGRLRVGDLK